MPDYANVSLQARIVRDEGEKMVRAIQAFNDSKVVGLTLTAGQKTELRTRFTDALAVVKGATAIIDTELAS